MDGSFRGRQRRGEYKRRRADAGGRQCPLHVHCFANVSNLPQKTINIKQLGGYWTSFFLKSDFIWRLTHGK